MADTHNTQEKRGSPLAVSVLGLVLIAAGIYLGGWLHTITPEQVARCEAQVRQTFPSAEQALLLPKCRNRHMIDGMNAGVSGMTAQQILNNLDAGKTVDMVSLFLGGAFIGGGIAAFGAANRIARRRKGLPEE